jgi:hypothetical protein
MSGYREIRLRKNERDLPISRSMGGSILAEKMNRSGVERGE